MESQISTTQAESHLDVSRRGFLAATAAGAAAISLAATARPAHADEGDSVLRVSSLNPDPADATAALQEAFDSDAGTVIVDKVAGCYLTGPLFIRRDNVQVIIESGVTVRSLGSAHFPELKDALITIRNQRGVTITGYGAQLVMNEYSSGEWRHVLNLLGVKDTVIAGVMVRGNGGDGVYVGNSNSGLENRNENVHLIDILSRNARRNSLSVITVDGLTVEGCAFVNTQGTAPQAGVDLEPNHANETLTDVVFNECWFEDNYSNGIVNHTTKLDATSVPYSILVKNTTIGRQAGGMPSFTDQNRLGRGQIELRDCLLDVHPHTGGIGLFDKSADAARVVITRTTVWDVGNTLYAYGPISVMSGNKSTGRYASYGAADFNDCVVVSDLAIPAFVAYDGGDGNSLTDVHGHIHVATPTPDAPQADFGASPTDVDLTTSTELLGTHAQVSVKASRRSVTGGGTVDLVFNRSGDLSTTLAIAYATSGTAKERYDYGGLGKVAVFKPGEREATVTVRTFARHTESDPERRSLVVSIAPGHRYQPVSARESLEVAIVG